MSAEFYEDGSLNGEITSEEKIKIYSPVQVVCGTIGGPVGVVYFLAKNFSALKNQPMKTKTLIIGGLSIVALALILPFLPEEIPSAPFTLLYIVIARVVSYKYQMSKEDIAASEQFEFQSNWKVFFIGLLCLVVSFIIVMIPLILFDVLGITTL